MAATIELKLGDLFDGPSDLIVLPCSTSRTITPSVADKLNQYDIPMPKRGMRLGDTDIKPLRGAENVAQFAAFAASVDVGNKSSADAIRNIATEIGRFTKKTKSVRRIAMPLLGTGAGGLSPRAVVDAIAEGFRTSAHKKAKLIIRVLRQDVLDDLLGAGKSKITTQKPVTPRRVFISYSGTSDRHMKWVAMLGKFLRKNGIDARLDQWHLRKGMDLPQWMTNELELAERVVIVTDSRYRDRADKRTGGVGWETMLIQGDMAQQPPDSAKYLVIVREDDFSAGVPIYLRTKFSIHWSSNSDEESLRHELLRELFDLELAPPIESPPSLYVAPQL